MCQLEPAIADFIQAHNRHDTINGVRDIDFLISAFRNQRH